jgi:hypothetical protein
MISSFILLASWRLMGLGLIKSSAEVSFGVQLFVFTGGAFDIT